MRPLLLVTAILLATNGCATKSPAGSRGAETGIASWYGVPFQGRKTASGEIFDTEKPTAAHRTLPFGSVVRVQHLANGRTVEVRINDRGPFVSGRIIDLSHFAAQTVEISGVGKVRLDVLRTPVTRAPDLFGVQIGSFSDREKADKLREIMEIKYGAARLVQRDGDQAWRVLVGLEPTIEGATALSARMDAGAGPAFIVRIDEN
jgi:rare lipoprotein A